MGLAGAGQGSAQRREGAPVPRGALEGNEGAARGRRPRDGRVPREARPARRRQRSAATRIDAAPAGSGARRRFAPTRPVALGAEGHPSTRPRRGQSPAQDRSDPLAEFRRQHGRPADGSDQTPACASGLEPGLGRPRRATGAADERGAAPAHQTAAARTGARAASTKTRATSTSCRPAKHASAGRNGISDHGCRNRSGARPVRLRNPAATAHMATVLADRTLRLETRRRPPLRRSSRGRNRSAETLRFEARRRSASATVHAARNRSVASPAAIGPRATARRRSARGPRPFGSKPFGSKPGGDRPYGDRPRGPKPFGSKPFGSKPFDSRWR